MLRGYSCRMNKFILGSGINGLIAGYYLPGYTIIGKINHSQESAEFPLGPRFLHFNKHTAQLLCDLGLDDCNLKTLKIGYFYNGSLHDEVSEKLAIEYFKKTRGDHTTKFDSAMSGGKKSITVFKTTMQQLYDKLLKRVSNIVISNRLIDENVYAINEISKVLITESRARFSYKKLVSTIPANVFFRLIRSPIMAAQFETKEKVFVRSRKILDLEDYDYVYFPEANEIIHRLGNTDTGSQIIETDDFGYRALAYSQDKDIVIYGSIRLPNAQMTNKVDVIEPNDVKFIGRYACWNHSKKIGEVISDVKDLCN